MKSNGQTIMRDKSHPCLVDYGFVEIKNYRDQIVISLSPMAWIHNGLNKLWHIRGPFVQLAQVQC